MITIDQSSQVSSGFKEGKYPSTLAENMTALPGIGVLCQGCQATGVHVSSYIDVHGGVGFGELSRERNSLSSQRRYWGPCQ